MEYLQSTHDKNPIFEEFSKSGKLEKEKNIMQFVEFLLDLLFFLRNFKNLNYGNNIILVN